MEKIVIVDSIGFQGAEVVYTFSKTWIDRDIAERNKIPHSVVYCIPIREDGKVLRIKRSDKHQETYAGYNSLPAGHITIDYDSGSPFEAAARELREETSLLPLQVVHVLGNHLFYDKRTAHFGIPFACLVDYSFPRFNEEIDSSRSGFEEPELILYRMKTENFTPLCKDILKEFFALHRNSKERVEELFF